jgi:hypothetical protein
MEASTPEHAAHVVQLALTPIFLLTGLASMLSVFTTRLGRVADRVHQHNRSGDRNRKQLKRLQLRSRILDVAVLMASIAGVLTCCAALTLFLGEIRQVGGGNLLFELFGAALVCAVLALLAFSCETILSGRTVREEAQPDHNGE